jgi:hypothetical protein
LANSEETNALSALKLTCQMLDAADSETERKYHKKRKLNLLVRLEELEHRKQNLEEESDRLRIEASKRKKQTPSKKVLSSGEVAKTPPQQVISISKDAPETASSSISISFPSTGKKGKPKRSRELVDLMSVRSESSSDSSYDSHLQKRPKYVATSKSANKFLANLDTDSPLPTAFTTYKRQQTKEPSTQKDDEPTMTGAI